MANSVKATDGEAANATFDPSKAPQYAKRVENLQAEIDEIMAKAQDECAPLREDITRVKKDAHEAGLPRKEFNAILRKRRLERQTEAIREGLSDNEKDNFDAITEAFLNETALGKAAKAKSAGEGATAH